MITVETTINASIEKIWDAWTNPIHIKNWCFASDDWYVPAAENDLRVGGKFWTVMSAKDSSSSFNFEGTYTAVIKHTIIEYQISDGRMVYITFFDLLNGVKITESFEPESINSEELQRQGWQAILDNFKKYVELKLN
jgi:uncharacterized protein YndB with AHSA1/START domain